MTPDSVPRRENFDEVGDFIAAHETFRDAQAPTGLAVLERAVRLGGDSLRGIATQVRRIRGREPEDDDWPGRAWMDLQFLIVILWRMRQAGALALSADTSADRLRAALARFDAQVPDLKRMRDVAQHYEEYAVDGRGRRHVRPGRADKIGRRMLDVGEWNGSRFNCLGGSIDFEVAGRASQDLFTAIVKARDEAAGER
ncbi:MAG: hypothetical protein QM572_11880 [Nocardioides sp.]|uniref:hypothetical protein n=1 Tax=Nocardioides sp. TaxID=35761 RepID=UPI0039E3A683